MFSFIALHFLLLSSFVVQYKYSCLLVYVYCRKHALCTTWFLNSLFSCGEPSPVHQTTIIWPRILGPVCQRKGTLTFWQLHWGLGKEEGRGNPFAEHASKTKEQQGTNMPPAASEPVGENEVASRQRGEVPLMEQ